MKRWFTGGIILLFLLAFANICYAGSIPEDLLGYEKALVFFGEVVSYNADESIAVMPTKKIKGDVEIGKELSYDKACTLGKFSIKKGETYLFGYYNENNPLYVFHTTSTEVETLKILDKSGGGQEERMQQYLNKGLFDEKEQERLKSTDAVTASDIQEQPSDFDMADNTGYAKFIAGSLIVIVLALIAVFVLRKKQSQR